MEFKDLALQRFSERRYDPRPIEQDKLEQILEAGRIAPTACNYQPQRFLLIRSEEARAKLRSITRFHYNSPMAVLVCYDKDVVWRNPYDRLYKDYNSGEQDASIAAASMMFEAFDIGVHSVWVRDFDSKAVIEAFEIPDNLVPVMILVLGYPGEGSKPNAWHFKKRPIEDFVKEL